MPTEEEKNPTIYDEDQPVTICKVENGYKIVASKEMHAYPESFVESHSASLSTGEYVFSDLGGVYDFLKTHFE